MEDIELSTIAQFLLRSTLNTHRLNEVGRFKLLQLFHQETGVIVVCEALKKARKKKPHPLIGGYEIGNELGVV